MVSAYSKAQTRAFNHLAKFQYHRLKGSTLSTCVEDVLLLEGMLPLLKERLVFTMRDDGFTWAEVADALGITEAQARYRYG